VCKSYIPWVLIWFYSNLTIWKCLVAASNLTARLICLPCSSGIHVISSVHQNMWSQGIRCRMSVGHTADGVLRPPCPPCLLYHGKVIPSRVPVCVTFNHPSSVILLASIWVLMTFLYTYLDLKERIVALDCLMVYVRLIHIFFILHVQFLSNMNIMIKFFSTNWFVMKREILT
jgi:hypothetical protein